MRLLDSMLAAVGAGALGRNTVLGSVGLSMRAVIQAVYLLALSRLLGPEEYGLFAGSVAAAVVLSPLASWGAGYLYARNVGRDPGAGPAMWAGLMVQVALSGVALVLVFMLAARWWLQARLGWTAMLAIAAAELLALPVALAAGRALMVGNRGGGAALTLLLVPAARLCALLLLWMLAPEVTANGVALAQLAASLVGAACAYRLFTSEVGAPAWRRRPSAIQWSKEGTPYALAAGAGVSYPEVDKPLILQLAGARMAGTYSAAFRVASLLTLPVAALVAAATPRLFAAQDPVARAAIVRRLELVSLAYGAIAAGACLLAAPLVPWVFGAGFADAGRYVAWLAAWVPLYAIHQGVGVRLTCNGRQGARATIEGAGLIAIVLGNLALVPELGALGAVFSLLAAEGIMIAGCLLVPDPATRS